MKLAAVSLVVQRGEKIVIDRLSFEVGGGEALLVTGPNGAGKTTLLRALAGLLVPLSGSLRLDGGDPERSLGEQCHYLGHANGVKSSLTVSGNLSFWAAYLGGGVRDPGRRVADAMDCLALSPLADVPTRYLSAGQKRRVGLARLLVARRPVWVLDEPTASLDAASTHLMTGIIDRHVGDGGLAIVATHLPIPVAGAKEVRL